MSKPICAFDVETTGLDPMVDRVLQLSCVRFDENGVSDSRVWYIKPKGYYVISDVAAEKTGLTKEIIEEKGVPMQSVVPDLLSFIDGCDLLVYNGSFDIHFLQCEFDRLGIDPHFEDHRILDAFLIETTMNSHKLEDVYRRMTGKELVGAHDALHDVNATIEVYRAQCNVYGDDVVDGVVNENNRGRTTDGWFRKNDSDEWVFAMGKYKDSSIRTVIDKDLGYLKWLCDTNRITIPTRKILKQEMLEVVSNKR